MVLGRQLTKRRNWLKRIFIIQFTFVFLFLFAIYRYCYCGFDSTSVDCVSSSSSSKRIETYLAVFIISSPDNVERRRTIRETWLTLGKLSTRQVYHLFVVGLKGISDELVLKNLKSENEQFDDLLILTQLEDTYEKLTSKVLESFVWFDRNVRFEFILKVDDDTFVRLDSFVDALRAIDDPKKDVLYWGFMDGRAPVRKTGKWAESDWILCDRYLPHALGGGYLLSAKLASFVASNARLLKRYVSEDVAVGAWLAGLDVFYLHDTRFDTEWKTRGCSNEYLVTHKQNDQSMKKKFASLKNANKLCHKEFRLRNSYLYDWKAPASKCCQRDNGTLP